MKRNIYALLVILLNCLFALAQNSERTESQPDSTKKKTSFTLAALYGSDVNYYGQTAAVKMPYALGYASVKFPSGFYLSGQTYKLINDTESGLSGLTLAAGYDFNLSKKLSGSLSYSRSFYPENSQFLQSANADMASANLTYDWNWLTTSLTGDYALGDDDALFTTFNISKYIDLGLSFSDKDYFTLEPSVEVIGGTQTFSDTTFTANPPKNNNGNTNGLLKKVLGGGKNGQNATVVNSTKFDLLAYNFTLPLAYNRSRYTIEASYQGAIPARAISNSPKIQSFFNLGFYYIF